MSGNPVLLPPERILEEMGKLFLAPGHDRHVYTVYGSYAELRPFQRRVQEAVHQGSFNSLGRVEYLSLSREIYTHLESRGLSEKASILAANRRDDELRSLLSAAFRELVTRQMKHSTWDTRVDSGRLLNFCTRMVWAGTTSPSFGRLLSTGSAFA